MAVEPSTPGLRVSDADREGVADALRGHCVAGRLSVAELEARLAATYAARTEDELAELLRDLPKPSTRAVVAATPPTSRRRPWPELPGARPFFERHVFGADREQVFANALLHIAPAMVAGGFDLAERIEPTLLVFEKSERPAWVPVVCILAFPIGLLSLMVRRTYRVVMSFEEASSGQTRVTIQGMAHRSVRRAIATLSD